MTSSFEFGIYTLADLGVNPITNQTITPEQRVDEIISLAKLADELEIDVFGVGEHHRLDYAVSSTAVMLAAIAQATKRIRLTSATTVLSTVDPVRLYEDYATLDLISKGRAEIIAGRGAFFESFDLFGYNPDDYDALFEEHAQLFIQLNKQHKIEHWEGEFRPSMSQVEIAPRPLQKEIPLWFGVGGSIESAERAARFGRGMAIAILGGEVQRFTPLVKAYRNKALALGHTNENLKIAVTGHTFIAETKEQAVNDYFPYYKNYKDAVSRQLNKDTHFTREQYDALLPAKEALFVGSPNEIVEKILLQHEMFGHHRFLAQMDIGGLPYDMVAKSLELFAIKVVPEVRKHIK